MNAQAAIKLVVEKIAPSKDWTHTDGVYADLSNWPRKVEYYAKCPKCSNVRGNFKTMKEAHEQRLCPGCNIKAVNDLKKQVRQVVHEPWKKVRTLSSIVRESNAESDPQPENNQPPEQVDPMNSRDPMAEINRLILQDWTFNARRCLAAHLDVDFNDIKLVPYDCNFDEDEPNNTAYFRVDLPGEEWLIFKNEAIAVQYTEERVRDDLKTEPDIFCQDWLISYIDEKELADAIGDPCEFYGEDERQMDYAERLEKMTEEDKIEPDDPIFYKKDGSPRVATPAREKQLNDILEQWIEETKPKLDPWDYLEDVYGKEGAIKQALEIVNIDVCKAAEDAVSQDGWQHFTARYSGNSVDLDYGMVACRIG